MKAVILAGGLGTRISEETSIKPKPMVEIGGRPILWHIMKLYSAHGVNDFIICCGYKGYVIKEYFANYFLHMSDVTFDMKRNHMEVHQEKAEPWRVTLIDTGEETMTGGRLRRISGYLKDEKAFCLTYGDGLSNVDIQASIDFHARHGKLATVTAVKPPGKYGALQQSGDQVTGFAEKPPGDGGFINGGFFVLSPACIDLIASDHVTWESTPLAELATRGELMSYQHTGFWQPMDTLREKNLLEELWASGKAPWKILVMPGRSNPDPSFWAGKRVLLTGHTGFKGAWLALWLDRLGAKVVGISLPPATTPSMASLAAIDTLIDSRFTDIRDPDELLRQFRSASPEIVLHLAAQALVRTSYRDPLLTFGTNVQGTANLLEAVRTAGTARVVVAITTDKVYRNIEQYYPYRETDPLGGHDPYSASKAAAEIVIASYRDAYLAGNGIAVASARAGNVIGGGDWSEDRLIPDAVRAWSAGQPLTVRRPRAFRPWQHVLEPLAAYLKLAERLWAKPDLAGAYNFGPPTHEAASVRDVVLLAKQAYGGGAVKWGEGDEGPHEAGWLALEITKAQHVLDVTPRWSLQQAVHRTMDWYRRQREGTAARELCARDIAEFEASAGSGSSV